MDGTVMKRLLRAAAALLLGLAAAGAAMAQADAVRIKDLGKWSGWRENPLVGYGLVSGLAGTGDSPRSQQTRQSIANMLQQFDLKLTPEQVASRNVAAVMITTNLPPFARRGDTLLIRVAFLDQMIQHGRGPGRELAHQRLPLFQPRAPAL